MRRGKRKRAPAEQSLTYSKLGETGNKRSASTKKDGNAKSAGGDPDVELSGTESDEEVEVEVERVVGRRKGSGGKFEYKIRWKGWGRC